MTHLLKTLLLLAFTSVACQRTNALDGADARPQDHDAPRTEGELSCTTKRDCTYQILPEVSSEADCSCPRCPIDSAAISRAAHVQAEKAFQKVCGEWARSNACKPEFCASPPKLACVEGECRLQN